MNSNNGKKINMKQQTLKSVSTAFALGAILMLGACHKKAAPPPPPPPPPAPSPTASISVSPDTIQQGQSATLSWQTSNATDVSIDGVGAVKPSGSQQVNPTDSTTYHLTAKGPAERRMRRRALPSHLRLRLHLRHPRLRKRISSARM